MDVPVEDEHLGGAVGALGVAGGDDGVVVDAVAHAAVGHGVVAGRADEGVGGADAAGHDRVDGGDGAAGGQAGDPVAADADRGAVAGVAAGGGEFADAAQVVGGVEGEEGVVVGRSGFEPDHAVGQAGQVEKVLGAADEGRAGDVGNRIGEGVVVAIGDQRQAGVVGQVAIVEDEPDRSFHGLLLMLGESTR